MCIIIIYISYSRFEFTEFHDDTSNLTHCPVQIYVFVRLHLCMFTRFDARLVLHSECYNCYRHCCLSRQCNICIYCNVGTLSQSNGVRFASPRNIGITPTRAIMPGSIEPGIFSFRANFNNNDL